MRIVFIALIGAFALFVFIWLTSEAIKSGDGKTNLNKDAAAEHDELISNSAASAKQNQAPLTGNQRLDKGTLLKLFGEMVNVPIKFWGRVIDENGVGLGGVKIQYRVQRFKVLPGERSTGELITNNDGSFAILNEKGATLSFEAFEKDGYQIMRNQKDVFGYSRTPEIFIPNSESPKTFIMRSRGAAQDVSSISQKFRIRWDGQPIRIDLDSGNQSPSGDLILTASRTASTGRFGWSLSLAIVGGGAEGSGARRSSCRTGERVPSGLAV